MGLLKIGDLQKQKELFQTVLGVYTPRDLSASAERKCCPSVSSPSKRKQKANGSLGQQVRDTSRYRRGSAINIKGEVGGHMGVSMPAIKYLKVMIDAKLSLKAHLRYEYQKPANATVALARIFPNFDESIHYRRLFLRE